MMTLPTSVRIVLFASEQVVPTLQFMLHAANSLKGRLASAHIYCTSDERRSREPATRLKAIFEEWCESNKLGVSVHLTEGEMWPADVRKGLTAWFQQEPDSEWWVNVTGGTKPMAAAATELTLATDLQARRVVYREFEGHWVELMTNDDNLLEAVPLSATTDPVVPPVDTLDRLLPLRSLVATQFSARHRVVTSELKRFPVDEALESVINHQSSWKLGLESLPHGIQPSSNGDAFERFVGAGLLDCGLGVKHSLKVIDANTTDRKAGQVVREVDLVVCHNSRLVLIDIKLPEARDAQKGTQLADVAELARTLGGNSALAVAVRPGWQTDEDVMRLAKALRVVLICQHDAPRLFSALLRYIDPKLKASPAITRAEAMLHQRYLQGAIVLSDGRELNLEFNARGTVDLEREAERLCQRRDETWVLMRLKGPRHWLCLHRLDYTKTNIEAEQKSRLRGLLSALEMHSAKGKRPRLVPGKGIWSHVDLSVGDACKAESIRETIQSYASSLSERPISESLPSGAA